MSSPIEAIHPLSPLQQGLLFHILLEPQRGLYLSQAVTVLGGDVDPEALARAWQRVVDRHAVLRSAFVWEGIEEPVQVVLSHVKVPFRSEDWRGLDAGEQARLLADSRRQERERGFDLTRAPLLRLLLLRLEDSLWKLIWTGHHLLLDAWSEAVLREEVSACYSAFARGEEPRLPPACPYGDYADWLARQDLAAAERFFRSYLAGVTHPTPLPGRQAEGGAGHGELRHRLAAEATAALAAFARGQRVSLGTLLQGIWALVLAHWGGGGDVVFGLSVSGRPADLPGVERMIGMLINTLPVRVRIDPGRPLGEWLLGLQAEQGELRRFEHAPLVEIQAWSEVPRGMPLFDSLFVLQNAPQATIPAGSASAPGTASVESLEFEGGFTNYLLSLDIEPGERLRLTLAHDRRRIDESTAARLLADFAALLEALPAPPDTALAALTARLGRERREQLRELKQAGESRLRQARRRAINPTQGGLP